MEVAGLTVDAFSCSKFKLFSYVSFFFVFSKVIQSAVGESPIELLFLRVYRKQLLKRKQSDSDGLKDI